MKIGNITKLKKTTKPVICGKKLLVLATAPEVKAYFDDYRVREYFRDYDVAVINKMPLCSETEMHVITPKYIIFFDGIFFDDYDEKGNKNIRKEWVEEVLERVDWECNLVVPLLAEYQIENPHIRQIYIGVLKAKYNRLTSVLYRHNIVNMGFNNVVMGAVYFGITFGYKQIALMGFTYGSINIGDYMDEDGLHVATYPHYYDEKVSHILIPNNELFDGTTSYLYKRAVREVESMYKFCELARYAEDNNVEIINYTPNNTIDVFKSKNLDGLIK